MIEMISTDYARTMVFCHNAGDDCPSNCPDHKKDACAFGLALDFPNKREKDLASDLLDSRAECERLRTELSSGIIVQTAHLPGKLDDAKALIREMAALVYGMASYSADCTCPMCEEKRMRRDEVITKMEGYL